MNENQIFTCDACRFTFTAHSLPVSCPDCGKASYNGRQAVRAATSVEIKEYFKIRRELAEENRLETEDKLAAHELLRAANL